MAITWGATSGGFRLGIDIAVSGTKATIIVYGQSVAYGHNWTYPLYFTGAWSGSKNVSFYSASSQTVTKELHRSSASFTGSRTYGARISYWNGSASVSRSVTIRPPKPNPPTTPTLTRVRRVSDTQHVVEWTHSGGAINFPVERRDYHHGVWSGWKVLSRPGGAARSFTDTTTQPDHAYQWRLSAVNAGGASGVSTNRTTVVTTPGAAESVQARRDGKTIQLSWVGKDSAPSGNTWHVQRRVGSGAWVEAAQFKNNSSTRAWTDTSSDLAGTIRYRVRQSAYLALDPGQTLYGEWTESNPVKVATAPNAPIIVYPEAGETVPEGRIGFKWKHNPTDGSAQTGWMGKWFKDGSQVAYNTGVSALEEVVWHPPSPGRYAFQVATKGAHANYSPWSPKIDFRVVARPVVTIDSPTDYAQHRTRSLTVSWSTTHEEGYPQHAFKVQLYDWTESGLVGEWVGTGAASAFDIPYDLENGKEYRIFLTAQANGIWSSGTYVNVFVKYRKPAPPNITAEWDENIGATIVYVDSGVQTPGEEETDHIDVYRSEDGGQTWKLLADRLDPASTAVDYQAPIGSECMYKALAVSGLDTIQETVYTFTAQSDKLWIGTGSGYTSTVGLEYNPKASGTIEAERTSLVFDGRELPVPVLGRARGRDMRLSGWLLDGEKPTLQDLTELLQGEHVTYLVRIPGASMCGIITSLDWDYKHGGAWPVSFTINETEGEVQP